MTARLWRMGFAVVVLAAGAALACFSAHAAEPAAAKAPDAKPVGAERYLTKGAPVRIRAHKMSVYNKQNRATFSGQVVAVQGDLTIRCNDMIAVYKAGGGLANLTATGNVRMRKADRRGTGQRLFYDHDRRIVELTGAPKLWEKDSFLEGARIMFFLDEDRVEVEQARGKLKVEPKEAP